MLYTTETRSIRLDAAYVRADVTYGRSGHCAIEIGSHNHNSRTKLRLPSGSWARPDNETLRPTILLRRISQRSDSAILYLTLTENDGVPYGCQIVQPVKIDCRKRSVFYYKPFEFTDYGGWRLLAATKVLLWDADYAVPPHDGPHPYLVTIVSYRHNGMQHVKIRRTRRDYDPGRWGIDQPLNISKGNDPLYEFGLHWKWWGEPYPVGTEGEEAVAVRPRRRR